MSEVKWIKITTNMFDDEKIKIIESMPDADSILVIWIKLLTLSGKVNSGGFIFLTENIPYTDEMLSNLLSRPLNTVRLALQTFKQFGMIDYDDKNFLHITNWDKHQNIDGLDKIKEQNRLRKYRQRQKQKELPASRDVTGQVTQCHATDIDIDKELDKELDIKKVYADSVTMTEAEYQKLIDKFGEGDAIRRINKLSVYKESKGKKYKSDYHTILMWASREDEQKPSSPSTPTIPILSMEVT